MLSFCSLVMISLALLMSFALSLRIAACSRKWRRFLSTSSSNFLWHPPVTMPVMTMTTMMTRKDDHRCNKRFLRFLFRSRFLQFFIFSRFSFLKTLSKRCMNWICKNPARNTFRECLSNDCYWFCFVTLVCYIGPILQNILFAEERWRHTDLVTSLA